MLTFLDLSVLADTPIGSRLIVIDRAVYADRMEGSWLGANIGNWTGRITEMYKIKNAGFNFFPLLLLHPAFCLRSPIHCHTNS